ncbi:hypothetical protein B5X24_HaOG206555 [Helicoverpa armigera]|uniref:Uncharacterized protein n=1 Tax=Helicoverpa armigera TaxID=29058 RepID=A0A2W1BR14_HELAM|nr:hypothetical protein B5X24_HaOG206555 [Helicoverpa armigera]
MIYAMVCVISQFQEYLEGRGTAAFESVDRNTVQYTVTAQQTTTTSSALSGRRRSAGRPMPSRCDPEEFSEAPTKIIIPRPLTAESSEPRPQNSKSILNKSKLPQRSNLNYKPVIGNVSVSNVGDGPEARDFDPRARGRGLQTDENRLPPRPKPKCQHVTAIVNVVRGRQGPDVQKSGYRAKSSGLQSDKNSPPQRFNLDSQNVTTNVNLVKGRDGPEPKESEPRAGGSGLQNASVLSRPSRSAVKKHVQFPDEQSCIEEATEAPTQPGPTEKPGEKYFPKCPCQCHILPRGARHLLIVDGIGVRGASAGTLTASQRAVLPARFPSSERATENVRSRSAARRRF